MIWHRIGLQILFFATLAAARPALASFAYEGVLTDSAGNPISSAAPVEMHFQIRNISNTCIMYDEVQNLSIPVSANGYFSTHIGSNAAVMGALDSGNNFDVVFSNLLAITGKQVGTGSSTTCTTTPLDERVMFVVVTADGVSETLGPIALGASPRATVARSAEYFGGKQSSAYLQTGTTGAHLTQANLLNLFSDPNYSALLSLLNGTSMTYAHRSSSGANALPAITGGSSAGDIWYDSTTNTVKFHNGSGAQELGISGGISSLTVSSDFLAAGTQGGTLTSSGAISLSLTGVSGGVYSKVTVDPRGRVTAGTGLAIADVPTLPFSKIDTLPTTLAGYGIVNAVMNNSGVPGLRAGNNSSKGAAAITGEIYIAQDTLQMFRANGSSWDALGGVGGGSGSVVVASAPLSTSNLGAGTIQVSLSAAGASTDGYLSTTDWNSFNNKLSTVAASFLNQNQIWVGDGTNQAIAVAPSGDLSMNSPGNFEVNKIRGHFVSAAPASTGQTLRYNGSMYIPNYILGADVRSSISGPFFPATCAPNEVLNYSVVTDSMLCQALPSNVLTMVTNLYVRNDGNDSTCNGSANTSGASPPNCAYATLQAALDKLPEQLNNTVTISLTGTFNAVTSQSFAVINKEMGGPGSLTIQGISGATINGATGMPVFSVLSRSLGQNLPAVTIKDFNISGPTSTGILVNGFVTLHNLSITNIDTGLNVMGGMAMWMGTNQISLGSGVQKNAIRIQGGGAVEMLASTTLTVSLMDGQRGIEVNSGRFMVGTSSSNLTLQFPGSGGNITDGIRISHGGLMDITGTLAMDAMNNVNVAPLSIDGGMMRIQTTGLLDIWQTNSPGIRLLQSGKLHSTGSVQVNVTGSGSGPGVVSILDGSQFVSNGHVDIRSNIDGPVIRVENNSLFKFEPYSGTKNFRINAAGGGANRVGFQVNRNSVVQLGASSGTGSYNFILARYADLTSNSAITFAGTTSGIPGNLPTLLDPSSTLENTTGGSFTPSGPSQTAKRQWKIHPSGSPNGALWEVGGPGFATAGSFNVSLPNGPGYYSASPVVAFEPEGLSTKIETIGTATGYAAGYLGVPLTVPSLTSIFEAHIKTTSTISNARLVIGWATDAYLGNSGPGANSTDLPSGMSGAYFRLSNGGSNWYCVKCTGSSCYEQNASVPASPDTAYQLGISFQGTGTVFKINNVQVCAGFVGNEPPPSTPLTPIAITTNYSGGVATSFKLLRLSVDSE